MPIETVNSPKARPFVLRYWKNNEKGDDKFIFWNGTGICKSNPKKGHLDILEQNLMINEMPNDSFCINISQIRSIEMYEGEKKITINHHRESTDIFHVSDLRTRTAIFNQLKEIEGAQYSTKELSVEEKTKTLKKSIIVFSMLFLFGFIFAILIEYNKLPGTNYPAILLLLGSLGSINVTVLYAIVLIIIRLRYKQISNAKRILHIISVQT
jgi:hypothetical protein